MGRTHRCDGRFQRWVGVKELGWIALVVVMVCCTEPAEPASSATDTSSSSLADVDASTRGDLADSSMGRADVLDASVADSFEQADSEAFDTVVDDLDSSAPMPTCPGGLGAGKEFKDLPYATVHPRQRLDLYLPKDPAPVPVLIWIHGGGWKAGDKASVPANVMTYVKSGYAVASVNYRLSDQPWPAPVADVKAAVRWLRTNAQAYGLDPTAFGAWGSSAGGHLVAMLALTNGQAALDESPASPTSAALQAAVNYFGPSDLGQMDNDAAANQCSKNSLCHDCAGSPEALLVDCPSTLSTCEVAKVKAGSPVHYVDAKDTPMILVHGTKDCTVPTPQSQRLHKALQAAGAWSELHVVQGAGHNHKAVSTPKVVTSIRAFLHAQLRGCVGGDAEPTDVAQCQEFHCAEVKKVCDNQPGCSELEDCFRECMYPDAEAKNCVGKCTKGVTPGSPVWKAHYALFSCANAQDCYALPAAP
ncbi:MAG TPA: hypothetical protein DCQ06_09130 [Myxococcales bacterium]|nr:hypothetical protein [Myxococcales bacterium]HAN31744.1 hypothetical protein [Myxococcales bacterium]